VSTARESPDAPEDDVEMGFFEHLGELRKRVMRALYGIVPGVALGWVFREKLLGLLVDPFTIAWIEVGLEGDPKLVFLNPIDPFVAYLKIAVITGIFIGAPWVFWQLWAFIAPGLYRREKRLAMPFVLVATIFFCGGLSFGYLAVFPYAFQYFLEFAVILPGGARLEPTIAINEILTFEVRMLLAFGLVFELPVVTTFLAAAGIVTWRQLLKFSRWWILIASVLSALLTPPDVGSQLMMLGPLIVLYFVSILFAMVVQRKKKEEPGEEDHS
jgi:sec-independent protein translocase protein TatC